MDDPNTLPNPSVPDPPDWAALPGEPPKVPFVIAWPDRVFALVFYGLGYFYLRYGFLDANRWLGGLFTLAYAAAIGCYFFLKHVKPAKFSWFWLAALLSLGLSFALFRNESLLGFDILVLHGLADHAAVVIVCVGEIHFTVEVRDLVQVAVAIVVIEQTISVRVGDAGQVIAVVGQRDAPAITVGYTGDMGAVACKEYIFPADKEIHRGFHVFRFTAKYC